MSSLDINIDDTALIFEGGGMRCSYTAAVVCELIDRNINFKNVYGISAGGSHSANYLSRSKARARWAFVDIVKDPKFGGIKQMLRGNHYFNSPYLYDYLGSAITDPNDPIRFDWETFCANPADMHIEAFDWDSGETKAWTKTDMHTVNDLMVELRAGASMPFFMPPTTIEGRTYMDGGMGTSWGILLDAAMRDGYKKFFIVRSQERGYRKSKPSSIEAALFRALFRKHPLVAERTIERWTHYNEILDRIDQLEAEGRAYVFCPDEMKIKNTQMHYDVMLEQFNRGLKQAQREGSAWEDWLQTTQA